jgi:hypothetical protein
LKINDVFNLTASHALMRKRTYSLIVAATATATAVSAINDFIGPQFGLWDELLVFGGAALLFVFISSINKHHAGAAIRSNIIFRFIALSSALVFGWSATLNLSYSIQIFAMPLEDDIFLAADRFLGFDYLSLMSWMEHHQELAINIGAVYHSFPIFIILLTLTDLALSDDVKLGERFFTSALIAFLLAFGICALLPAAGAASLLDPDTAALATGATPLDRLYALRSGTVHQFSRGAAGGLVSFPSMHVAIAVLALHATRRVRWLFLCVLPICLGFCITALTHGGHYLVDCFAGAAVAAVAIKLNSAFHNVSVPHYYVRVLSRRGMTGDGSGAVYRPAT